MENTSEKKQSLLNKILDGLTDAIKRPFVVKRISRGFASAADSLEEQILGVQARQNTARENLVRAAKSEEKLGSYIQELIDLQAQLATLKTAQENLKVEEEEFLG